MNKVHAFQIEKITSTDWMFCDESAYFAVGTKGEMQTIPDGFYELFNPEVGHWCIVWEHGLVTFRPNESFQRDFRRIGVTQFETSVTPLFFEARQTEEWKARKAAEREAYCQWQAERHAKQQEEFENIRKNPVRLVDGVMVRRVIPGTVGVPRGMTVQPMAERITNLPIFRDFNS